MKATERDDLLIRLDERTQNIWRTLDEKLPSIDNRLKTLNNNVAEHRVAIAENRKDIASNRHLINLLLRIVLPVLAAAGGAIGTNVAGLW